MRNKLLTGLALLLLFSVGCQELVVENPNSPDTLKALAEPGDVEQLIADTFTAFWSASEWCGVNMVMSVTSNAHSCSWGNWGMRDMSEEPRIPWNNDPAYSYAGSTEDAWFRAYTGISNAGDGLKAIAANSESFVNEGIDVDKLRAFAKFTMGLNYYWLAVTFDKAFLVDETVDLETAELSLVPYSEVAAFAVDQLQQAIDIAGAANFTITAEEDWVYGLEVTSDDLVALAKTYQARALAYAARTPSERDAADWGRILTLLNAGVDEFTPIGDDDGEIREWKCTYFYANDGSTWSRANYRTIGPADESVCDPADGEINCYQEWLDTTPADRNVFDITSADRRLVGGDGSDVTVSGSLFEYWGIEGPFPPARGTWHYSSHSPLHGRPYRDANANGNMTTIHPTEVRMLKAEALLRTSGSLDEVAALINESRVTNGGMNPASAANGAGSASDAQSHLDTASLWSMLKHEKRLECMLSTPGLELFDDRGWGDLVTGTPIHFPVPGKELQTIQVDNYTFGGVGGDGAAPKAQMTTDRFGTARANRERFGKVH